MDTIVHSAIEEICSQGATGLSLSLLWPRLHAPPPLCPAIKRAVLTGLSAVPGLQFKARDGSDFDPNSKPVEEWEGLGVKVIADEQLRRCFVGLYDVKAGNGVTQNQLCKELGMPANNFFYVVKRLESWGLVVRHSTIVRTKEASIGKEPKISQPVHTNLIRLHRYAPSMSSQQRLEITLESSNLEENQGNSLSRAEAIPDESSQDDVLVKDFLPALKAICDRLEQAEGKVLVVSDIKRELGYRETRGHRAWRNVCNRLKQAGLVEVFEANVAILLRSTPPTLLHHIQHHEVHHHDSTIGESCGGGEMCVGGTVRICQLKCRPVSCLKLLKKFSPKLFEHKSPDCEDENLASDQHKELENQFQNTEQLVELPLEQQIIDMIDAEGSKGLLGVEVCKRLGISSKMLDNLSNSIVPRFGLHQLSENRKRGSAYRFWTRGNFCPKLPNSSFIRVEDGPAEVQLVLSPAEEASLGVGRETATLEDDMNSQSWLVGENTEKGVADGKRKYGSPEDRRSSEIVIWDGNSDAVAHDMSVAAPHAVDEALSNSLVEAPSSPVHKSFKLQQGQRYPSLTSATRELRILEKLETEKIIIKPELQRWLESFEKDKLTRMDRKTLQRCLTKLKQEGRCKLMEFNIPGVSNCGRHREILVVVHPSIKGSASELSEQVHDKLRSFEMRIRSSVSPLKKHFPVPVLHGIERIHMNSTSDAGTNKAETMRANGFVLAKMVRTKLLHCFLWDFVNNSDTCVDIPSNPHSSCLLFSLDSAIKAMPLELFLQVVGSALKWEDMTEKCKNGLLLSDFPDEEYKSLMDTRATGRLSWLLDILRRLKLIKLVADETPKDAVKLSLTTLVYALELKPYIEEPPSVDPLPGCSGSIDLRPHFRHDFVLTTTDALEKYWQTLEYCYSAADPKAAVHAFPGSMCYEVCLYRSWTTVRVMKAGQRDELLKRIKDQQNKKLTFMECREIAKELNLTLQQVLRIYYDNRQKRLDKFQADSDVRVMGSNIRDDRPQSQRKRKRRSEGSSVKDGMINHPTESLEVVEDEQEQHESLIGQCIVPIFKQARKSKFLWTEEADRQLIVQYARQKAIQGARRGTDWALVSDLPADTTTCRRRLASLRSDMFRKSLMRLCNLLTQRYAQHVDRERKLRLNDCSEELNPPIKQWDDFEDSKIKVSLHDVLTQMTKMGSAKRPRTVSQGPHKGFANTHCALENDSEKQLLGSNRKSRRNRLPQKFVKHLKEGVCVIGRVNQSLAASSAVELFKLVFLTNSKSADMPNLLAETLRCYSQHDQYTAFDYLRQNKFLVGSGASEPFVLSQSFLRNLSLSPFPANTGKRAARLASWVHEKEEKLMEGTVNLHSDLQCGDIFQLLALVSSRELSISPVLPHEGVGETEDSRTPKRKSNDHEDDNCSTSKKQKSPLHDTELYSRREKGFRGITVSLSRITITRSNIVELFKDDQNLLISENDDFNGTLGMKSSCTKSSISHVKEAPDFDSINPSTIISGNSIWEVMATYTIQKRLNPSDHENIIVHPELFKTAYRSIQKAGDQGVSMSKVSECIGIQGTILNEHVVDVLELFGFVLKVNGYNYVRVVDGLYRGKYFLTSKATSSRDPQGRLSSISQRVDEATNMVKEGINQEHEVHFSNVDDVHKVTILNLSEDISQLSNAIQTHDNLEGHDQTSTSPIEGIKKNQNFDVITGFQPILPWINGDGNINGIVCKGLTRRIIGIVTQNPGIMEDAIIRQMEVLNPQSCRKLLELMILDKHLFVRKMCQKTSSATPPALLENLLGNRFKKSKYVCREHYFANPMSTASL
ncbi:hypothetical protein KSS87_015506 [Heliosperma pusillum]|nr:hypothetical protein KSS87_015506 [Heliosperma pusillum]